MSKYAPINDNACEEITKILDLNNIAIELKNKVINRRTKRPDMKYLTSIGKILVLPEELFIYGDETITGVCLSFLNKQFTECQASISRKQKSERQSVAYEDCATLAIMVVVDL